MRKNKFSKQIVKFWRERERYRRIRIQLLSARSRVIFLSTSVFKSVVDLNKNPTKNGELGMAHNPEQGSVVGGTARLLPSSKVRNVSKFKLTPGLPKASLTSMLKKLTFSTPGLGPEEELFFIFKSTSAHTLVLHSHLNSYHPPLLGALMQQYRTNFVLEDQVSRLFNSFITTFTPSLQTLGVLTLLISNTLRGGRYSYPHPIVGFERVSLLKRGVPMPVTLTPKVSPMCGSHFSKNVTVFSRYYPFLQMSRYVGRRGLGRSLHSTFFLYENIRLRKLLVLDRFSRSRLLRHSVLTSVPNRVSKLPGFLNQLYFSYSDNLLEIDTSNYLASSSVKRLNQSLQTLFRGVHGAITRVQQPTLVSSVPNRKGVEGRDTNLGVNSAQVSQYVGAQSSPLALSHNLRIQPLLQSNIKMFKYFF